MSDMQCTHEFRGSVQKSNDFRGTLYPKAFGVADYEFDNSTIFAQLWTRGFSGSLITDFKLDYHNSI